MKLFFTLLLLNLLIIFLFSSQTGEVSQEISDIIATGIIISDDKTKTFSSLKPLLFGLNFRKYAHIILFSMLGITSMMCALYSKMNLRKKYITVFLFCEAIALSDELHQMFIPNRTARIQDIGIDSIGIISGILVISCIYFFRQRV